VLAAGTYPEGPLVVSRSVTIRGPNAGIPGGVTRFLEATITSPSTGFALDTGAIVLDGLEIDAGGAAIEATGTPLAVTVTSCVLSGAAGADVSAAGGVTLGGNHVTAASTGVGLRVTAAGPEGVVVRGNLVEDVVDSEATVTADAVGIRVEGTDGPVEIDGNTVTGTRIEAVSATAIACGIRVTAGLQGAVLSDNHVSGTGCDLSACTACGIRVDGALGSDGTVDVYGNAVAETHAFGPAGVNRASGIGVLGAGPIRVAGNTVRATTATSDGFAEASGLTAYGDSGAVTVEGNRVTATVAGGIAGATATAAGIAAGRATTADVLVSGNEVRETYGVGEGNTFARVLSVDNAVGSAVAADNVVSGFDFVGITVVGATGATARGNQVAAGSALIGISIIGGPGVRTAEGNVVLDAETGIEFRPGAEPPTALLAVGNRVERAGTSAVSVSTHQVDAFAGTIDLWENTIVDSWVGLLFTGFAALAPAAEVQARFNRFAGDEYTIVHQGTGAVQAMDNWFGCNEGPRQPGCGELLVIDSGVASVDFDPWLQLTATSEPSEPLAATIAASLTRNSDGIDTSADGHVPDGTAVAFATTFGTVAETAATVDGTARVSLSSETAGPAVVTATLDAAAASTVVDLAKRALVSGRRLLLRVGATKQALQVVSKDLALPLGDGPGSGDDPTVHGGSLRLRWSVGAAAAFDETYALPAASWQAISRNGVVKGYRLAPVPPFTQVVVKPGKVLRILGAGGFGFSLDDEPDAVDVVLTLGSMRHCMTFGGDAVFTPGRRYVAKDAPVSPLCPPPAAVVEAHEQSRRL
jgi:hypothetical protein